MFGSKMLSYIQMFDYVAQRRNHRSMLERVLLVFWNKKSQVRM